MGVVQRCNYFQRWRRRLEMGKRGKRIKKKNRKQKELREINEQKTNGRKQNEKT